ncbi:MAG TPA: hypothetical protein ENL09_04440 [Bacteroidetes bacterium]|nr:hypothetical protein [Bacteroidota bacterium]
MIATSYWLLLGYINLAKGNLVALDEINAHLSKIRKDYNFIHAELDFYEHSAHAMLNRGKIAKAIELAEAGDKLADKHDDQVRRLSFLGIIVKSQAKRNNYDTVSDLIDIADEVLDIVGKDTVTPYFYVSYLNAKSLFNIYLLESHKSSLKSVKTKDILSGAKAIVSENVKYSAKRSAYNRVEAYGYMAKYLRMTKKYGKALKYYDKAIKEGERLGANLELSRVYVEVGKFLLSGELKQKGYNGITPEGYFQNGKSMFEEMGLKWDLEQLDIFLSSI